jgi:hypothetical protein
MRAKILRGGNGVADRSGRGLMTAGAIVTLVGTGIILIKVLRVPEYWLPVMVGLGLFFVGAIRWLTSGRD